MHPVKACCKHELSQHLRRRVPRPVYRKLPRAALEVQAVSQEQALRVAVYSSQRYVHGFLKQPMLSAFPNSTMIEVFPVLSVRCKLFNRQHPASCAYSNTGPPEPRLCSICQGTQGCVPVC